MVVPPELSHPFGELAASLAPAPAAAVQRAAAEFLREGHYIRHLRRMKRLYAARRETLLRCLGEMSPDSIKATAGLAVVMLLPNSASDVDIASRALEIGLAPGSMSAWYMQPLRQQGLLLCVTNLNERRLPADCRRLLELAR
jgi:GntR family transcriptional regulator/MocR family aminotransferase